MFSDNIVGLDGPVRRFRRWFRHFLGQIARHRKHQRQYRKLQELPDYLLEDVGLTRADLRDASIRHD